MAAICLFALRLSSVWLHGLSWPTLRMLCATLAPFINLPDFNGVDVWHAIAR